MNLASSTLSCKKKSLIQDPHNQMSEVKYWQFGIYDFDNFIYIPTLFFHYFHITIIIYHTEISKSHKFLLWGDSSVPEILLLKKVSMFLDTIQAYSTTQETIEIWF